MLAVQLAEERITKELAVLDVEAREPPSQDYVGKKPVIEEALRTIQQDPLNAEPRPYVLAENFITPNRSFFVRNHLQIPQIDGQKHCVTVKGLGLAKPLCLNIGDLKAKFQNVSICATLQCAGNRRSEMQEFKKVEGIPFQFAVSNAKWTGVRLRDVLLDAGVDPNSEQIKHVQFEGADEDEKGRSFEASIPFEKAMRSEVLLAFEMNGEELSLQHGYPLRLVVPGTVGVRHVKWLKTIRTSDEESTSEWQKDDYRMLFPSVGLKDARDSRMTPAIQEPPVQSAFTSPTERTRIKREAGLIEVCGYAWSGGGRGIIRVEVSADGGRSWQNARLMQDNEQDLDHMWAWTFFKAEVNIPDDVGHLDLVCKATDRSYNTQPETADGIWNVRGFLHNSWHHVRVDIVD